MIQTCSKCKNYDIRISDEPCRKCQQAFRRGEGKPNFIASITNADRIRSMTDEELAELFMQEYDGADSFTCPVPHPCPPEKEASCRECFLDWLQEEAET